MRLERRLSRGSRVTIAAPPGKLGVFLENRKDSRGTVVTKVRPESPLAALIQVGDRILAIDGADVSLMTVSEITTIMQQTNNRNRTLTVLKTTEDSMSECEV
jgi:C-terminal processing protease CtpA/Prc